jgi:transcriptional regulator with XRE-family HTH domain
MTNEDPTRLMRRRHELAAELRRLMERSGISGRALAAQLGEGWSQSRISRILGGTRSITADHARAFARAVGATEAELVHLDALIDRARAELVTEREIRAGGGDLAVKQQQFGDLERSARRIRTFSRDIPGLLQIPDIARYAFTRVAKSPEEIAASVAKRMARQQILYDVYPDADPDRPRFEFVLTEQGLRWRMLPKDGHLKQLYQVRQACTMRGVRLGIIPQTALAPVWHHHSFTILGDRDDDGDDIVSYEPLAGEGLVSEHGNPDRFGKFVAAFEALQQVAVYSDEALAVIDRVVDDVRQFDDDG